VPIFVSAPKFIPKEHGQAIKLGADSYGQLSKKPTHNFVSIMSMIESMNNYNTRQNTKSSAIISDKIMISGNLHQVFVDGKEIGLTNAEFNMLYYFMSNKDNVLTVNQIYDYTWGDKSTESVDNSVKCAILRLRKKLGVNNATHNVIENVWGAGYKFKDGFGKSYEHM